MHILCYQPSKILITRRWRWCQWYFYWVKCFFHPYWNPTIPFGRIVRLPTIFLRQRYFVMVYINIVTLFNCCKKQIVSTVQWIQETWLTLWACHVVEIYLVTVCFMFNSNIFAKKRTSNYYKVYMKTALTSTCELSSIPGWAAVICELCLFVILFSCHQGFYRGSPVFLP